MVKLTKIPDIRIEINQTSLKRVVRQLNRKGCQPKGNLVFLKTHKCGSTSLFNLFTRYGLTNNKLIVIPKCVNYMGHPLPFKRTMARSLEEYNQEYNILTHHSRLNYTEMRDFMPNDTIFVTIVREPVFQFESMIVTYNLKTFWNLSIEQLNVTDPELPEKVLNKRVNGRIGINQMIFDMGLDEDNFTQPQDVSQYISRLDSIFDLVLIMERMEESLVLLKHLMCWKTDDVVMFKVFKRWSVLYLTITRLILIVKFTNEPCLHPQPNPDREKVNPSPELGRHSTLQSFQTKV